MTFFPPPAFPFSGLILKLELGVQTLGSCGPQLELSSVYTCSDCFGLILSQFSQTQDWGCFCDQHIMRPFRQRVRFEQTNLFQRNLISQKSFSNACIHFCFMFIRSIDRRELNLSLILEALVLLWSSSAYILVHWKLYNNPDKNLIYLEISLYVVNTLPINQNEF